LPSRAAMGNVTIPVVDKVSTMVITTATITRAH
jgi:hypothetical protein